MCLRVLLSILFSIFDFCIFIFCFANSHTIVLFALTFESTFVWGLQVEGLGIDATLKDLCDAARLTDEDLRDQVSRAVE
jgi:hypothetical protein